MILRLISAHQPGAIGRRNSARGQIPVNPSLILLVKMAAFVVRTQSRFGGGHDDIAGLIGCGVMRNLMIFAAVMIGLGTTMAQMADKMMATTPALATTTSRQTAHAQTIG